MRPLAILVAGLALAAMMSSVAEATTAPELRAYIAKLAPTYAKFTFVAPDAALAAKAASTGMKTKSLRRFDLVQSASDRLGTDGVKLNQMADALTGIVSPGGVTTAHRKLVRSFQWLAGAYLGLNQAYDQWLYDFQQFDADRGDPGAVLADLDTIAADEKVIAARVEKLPSTVRVVRGLQTVWRTSIQAAARRSGTAVPSWVAAVGKP